MPIPSPADPTRMLPMPLLWLPFADQRLSLRVSSLAPHFSAREPLPCQARFRQCEGAEHRGRKAERWGAWARREFVKSRRSGSRQGALGAIDDTVTAACAYFKLWGSNTAIAELRPRRRVLTASGAEHEPGFSSRRRWLRSISHPSRGASAPPQRSTNTGVVRAEPVPAEGGAQAGNRAP